MSGRIEWIPARVRAIAMVMAVTIGLGALLGALVSLAMPKQYVATASFMLVVDEDLSARARSDNITMLSRSLPTLAQVLRSPDTLQPIADELQVPGGLAALQTSVMTNIPVGTLTMHINVRWDDPAFAARIADAVAAQVPEKMHSVVAPEFRTIDLYEVDLLGDATVPILPSSPSFPKNIFAGMLLGGVAGWWLGHHRTRRLAASPTTEQR